MPRLRNPATVAIPTYYRVNWSNYSIEKEVTRYPRYGSCTTPEEAQKKAVKRCVEEINDAMDTLTEYTKYLNKVKGIKLDGNYRSARNT